MRREGVIGTPIFGGYVLPNERNPSLIGQRRYETYSDLMANVSIISAGIRHFVGLTSRPRWKVEPALDVDGKTSSDAAKAAAEFVDSCLRGTDANLTRLVRRASMYRFYGFGCHEWTAKRRPDGLIGMESVDVVSCHTIDRWDVTEAGDILGIYQRSPNTSQEIHIKRRKLIYLVDDTLSDSPEGFGLFRHMADSGHRLQVYTKLESQGFERDLRGIPVGYAPMAEIEQAVKDGVLSEKEGKAMTLQFEAFLRLQAKGDSTGMMLDSSVISAQTETGETLSTVRKWQLDLLSSQGGAFADIAKAIDRLRYDLAMIIGVEGMLIGSGSSGSRALSEDKSRNLYLQANSTLQDVTESYDRDFIGPLWRLNGLPDAIRPTLAAEDVSFTDAEAVARTLAEMATAGAVLTPDDPAINEVRDLLGVARPPEDMAAAIDESLRGSRSDKEEDKA